MAEDLLNTLLRQAALLSAGTALLWALRPLVLRCLGAGTAYAAWLLVPALLLTPALPRPAQEPLQAVLRSADRAMPAALTPPPAPAARLAPIGLALWLAGAASVAALLARRQLRLARPGERLPTGSSPALVGLLRPRIALPADFEQRFTPAERELILAHERAHRDRLDNFWNLLASALAALHWWNPLTWWAWRRLRADQELACDAAVLAARPGAAPTYSRALLAAHGLTAPGAPLASRWGTTHPLVERIAMLKHPRPLTRRRAMLLAAAASAVTALAYAAEGPAPAGKGFVQLEVRVERSRSGATSERTSQTLRLIGKDGERIGLRLNPIPAEKPNWTTEPLSIELRPRQTGENEVLIDTRISHGEPGTELGQPKVLTAWGQKARIEIDAPDGNEKFSLELTPTALPADYQPPARPAAKPL